MQLLLASLFQLLNPLVAQSSLIMPHCHRSPPGAAPDDWDRSPPSRPSSRLASRPLPPSANLLSTTSAPHPVIACRSWLLSGQPPLAPPYTPAEEDGEAAEASAGSRCADPLITWAPPRKLSSRSPSAHDRRPSRARYGTSTSSTSPIPSRRPYRLQHHEACFSKACP